MASRGYQADQIRAVSVTLHLYYLVLLSFRPVLAWGWQCSIKLNILTFFRSNRLLHWPGYYHDMFLQNSPQMAQSIVRQKLKGTGPRRPAQPDTEPNFYSMPLPEPETPFATSTAMSYVDASSLHCNGASLSTNPEPPSSITLRNSLGMPLLSTTMPFPMRSSSSAEDAAKRDVLESIMLSGSAVTDEDESAALEDPGLWRYLGGL